MKYPLGGNITMAKELNIKWQIPYKELIRKNGLKTCLEIVPGTRQYLTHNAKYGKKLAYGKQ